MKLRLWLGSGSAHPVPWLRGDTGILDIPVLYLCFDLLSYLAFALAKFVH